MRILLTVPHDVCILPTRDCDERALALANNLATFFEKRGDTVTMIKSNIYRQPDADANRTNTRKSEFRQAIRSALPDIDFIIDCHSFWTGAWGPSTPSDAKLVFLLMDDTLRYPIQLGKMIATKALGRYVYILQGATANDILLEAYERAGKMGVLVEINEQLSDEDITEYAYRVFLATVSVLDGQSGRETEATG
jgi:hypothetical protein